MATFSFNGVSSDNYGLKIKLLQPPQRAENATDIIYIPGRAEPLIKTREEFQSTELTFEIVLREPSRIRDIFTWLKGEGKLIYSEEPDKFYNVVSNSVISVTRISDEIRELTIKFICLPFAYAVIEKSITNSYSESETYTKRKRVTSFANTGTIQCEPVFRVKLQGKAKIYIDGDDNAFIIDTGQTDGVFDDNFSVYDGSGIDKRKYTPPISEIFVDCSLKIAYTVIRDEKRKILSRTVVNEKTTGYFPAIPCGSYDIAIETIPTTFSNGKDWDYIYYNNILEFDIIGRERWL